MPTLIDVAKVAGVGVMSVSRVVNGSRKVSPETQRKVLAAIERIGYEPNEAARVLKGHRSSVIGLIVPDLADPFFATCANAVQETARHAGFLTWMAASAHREDVERELTKEMMQRYVAGLLIIPSGSQNDHLALALKRSVPIVAFDRPLQNVEADAIVVDNRAATASAIAHLIEHGHRNILCITDDESIFTKMERVHGYTQGMRRAKLLPQICSIGSVLGSLSDQLGAALKSPNPPTAIFAESNLVAIETLHELQRRSIKIPEQMAIIAFDDFDAATLVRPAITVVKQPVAELGRRAAEQLCNRLNGSDTSKPSLKVLKTELVIRESCGCGSPRRSK